MIKLIKTKITKTYIYLDFLGKKIRVNKKTGFVYEEINEKQKKWSKTVPLQDYIEWIKLTKNEKVEII